MQAVPPWVYYSVYRVLMFVVPLAVLLAANVLPWLATLLAAVIGLCLSYIFLKKPRESVARDLYEVRHGRREPVHIGAETDAETEDAAVDRLLEQNQAASATSAASASRSEREGGCEQHAETEGSEAAELERKNQLP